MPKPKPPPNRYVENSVLCATVRFAGWLTKLNLVLTVKVIRAPMGTKATPTASLSIFIPTRIHNVDTRPVWCQLGEQQIIKPLKPHLYIPPYAWSLWIFKWNGRPLTCTQGQTGISRRLSILQTWRELKLGNIFGGWGCKRGNITKAVYCHCDDPDILEQPRGASLFVQSSTGSEKT